MAFEINGCRLRQLNEKIFTFQAEVSGEFERHSYPADLKLQVAKGSQVMLLNNDSSGRWVNGSLGKIEKIEPDEDDNIGAIHVRLRGGTVEKVLPYSWELFRYRFNEETLSVETETSGIFRQFPLKLAWAITIHKSQGKTFDKVVHC
jgi:ATP-dependent exoDNAse (exonuclease V) alpha subunit